MTSDESDTNDVYTEKKNVGDELVLDEVEIALGSKDWQRLRTLSLRTGGFGSARVKAWYPKIILSL